ncbi:flotillin family protein [Chondromyces crocatus]|uniref:flotillin family protein n=1 Tax=Chondromyces crocatus TaxID=52 RepID=UPI003CCBBBF9
MVVICLIALAVFGTLLIVAKFYRQVEQGRALIINTMKTEPIVTFTGKVVYPIINKAEIMDISVKTVEIDRRGKEGLICKDNIRADIKVTFFVRVNKTQEDVLKVAQAIGCARASDHKTLEDLFTAKFSEALKTVGKRLNFEDLYKERQQFKDDIIDVIGKDLNGFVLDDAAIDYLEQTPLEALDKDNIMDAEGIKKITDLTVIQNILTNELRQKERMEIGSQNLHADEAVFQFEHRRAEAEAKAKKEISIAQSREENEAARVASEEEKKTLLVKEKNEEEARVAREAKERGIAIAERAKVREIQVETERVERAKQLEVVARERDVSLQQIAREKELEQQRKEIADVIRGRISVDKTVAEEEERIKDVRAVAEANRLKDVTRINAEAEAQEQLVKQLKSAEASEEAAKFRAREKVITADAELEASDKATRAKIRIAEGVQAEAAAEGLAKVRIREADAAALEKTGLAEARVTLEKLQAAASGEEKQGMVRVKVREADAAAIERQGLAEANVAREKLLAEATGVEKRGLAEANVAREKLLAEATGIEQRGLAAAKAREAEAVATEKMGLAEATSKEKMGLAEATAVKERLLAEASGTAEKAAAMKALDGLGREHEEFRLRLEKEKLIELEQIRTRVEVARAQSEIIRSAFSSAKINIVGGDGAFFDRFMKAVTLGQTVDGVIDQSATVKTLFEDVVNRPGSAPAPSLSDLLGRLVGGASDPESRKQIQALADKARELGIDDLGKPPQA